MGMTGVSFVSIIVCSPSKSDELIADPCPDWYCHCQHMYAYPREAVQEALSEARCCPRGSSLSNDAWCTVSRQTIAEAHPDHLSLSTLPVSMFILAFTSYPGIIWVGPCMGGIIFGFSVSIGVLANISVSEANFW